MRIVHVDGENLTQRSSIQNSSFEKTKQNNHPRSITNSLEKAGITTFSSYTIPAWEISNKRTRVLFNTKQTSTNRDKEIEDLRNQMKLLNQNQRQRDA